ncbi:MAG: hypothetical protein A2Y38_05660 [Spirochaetes bacterium GWB1_59_5]|nr:MAG: hypothetical protein A2Y38_05660 [Spirochaetes bacterium GWB1_59_5]
MAAFPILSTPPSYPIDPDGELEDVVLRSQQEAGYEQTRPRTTRARRNFGVSYIGLEAADEALLRAFEITTLRNGADSFTWTHPKSGTTYTVRLIAPIKFTRRKYKVGAVDVVIKMREG